MVIGVLSILLAVILPTIKSVRNAALRKRAQAEATALAQAAIRYKAEYGFWPGQLTPNADGETVSLRAAFRDQAWTSVIISRPGNTDFTVTSAASGNSSEPDYLDDNAVYQAFRRVGQSAGTAFNANLLNPKGIRFIDLQSETDPLLVGYPDPWGRNYILFMGLNPRSTFTHTVTPQGGGAPAYTVSISNTIAFAFSYGPNGKNSTNYIYSAGVGP